MLCRNKLVIYNQGLASQQQMENENHRVVYTAFDVLQNIVV
jgi:hypothetical protein